MVCLFIRFFSFFSKFYCVFLHAILFLLYGFISSFIFLINLNSVILKINFRLFCFLKFWELILLFGKFLLFSMVDYFPVRL